MSLSDDNQSEVIKALNSTSRYLDDLLNIDNTFFNSMVNHIYPSELQLNRTNISDTEASFLDLHLSISEGFAKTKIFDKRDDFDFDSVNFPFLDDDIPPSTSYAVYISQLIRFARVSSYIDDFNTRNKIVTTKLLRQGYGYHIIVLYVILALWPPALQYQLTVLLFVCVLFVLFLFVCSCFAW